MKKSLLLFASFAIAIAASAAKSLPVVKSTPIAKKAMVENVKTFAPIFEEVTPVKFDKVNTRRANSIAGTYIMSFIGDFKLEFKESSSFTVEQASGTIDLDLLAEEGQPAPKFDYNVVLKGFGAAQGVAYGYYDQDTKMILLPVQTIYTHATYGRFALTGLALKDGEPYSTGYPITLSVDEEEGTVSFYEDALEEFIEEGDLDEGCTLGGWYTSLPDYEGGGAWSFGYDCEMFAPNAILESTEVHIESGAWGKWANHEYTVAVEDYDSEIIVHNFFGLFPLSISVDGNVASIFTPVQAQASNYGTDEEPDYIQIWQWDDQLTGPLPSGEIKGEVSVKPDGTKTIYFFNTEYKEAWDDAQGHHEAGNYYITDYTKWFMVHSTWGDQGAYWWGEARNIGLTIFPNAATSIKDVNAKSKKSDMAIYNLMGQKVNSSAKGLVIRDGKKFIVK